MKPGTQDSLNGENADSFMAQEPGVLCLGCRRMKIRKGTGNSLAERTGNRPGAGARNRQSTGTDLRTSRARAPAEADFERFRAALGRGLCSTIGGTTGSTTMRPYINQGGCWKIEVIRVIRSSPKITFK